MNKIYKMINGDSGASIICSGLKLQVNSSMESKTAKGFPLLSTNHYEYDFNSKSNELESVNEANEAMEFYRRKSYPF